MEKEDDLWSEIMQEVDKDHDNKISYQEFSDAMTAVLKNRLTNSNGNRIWKELKFVSDTI